MLPSTSFQTVVEVIDADISHQVPFTTSPTRGEAQSSAEITPRPSAITKGKKSDQSVQVQEQEAISMCLPKSGVHRKRLLTVAYVL